MTESIAVNGSDLSTLVSNVESLAGLLRSPQVRGEGVTVPGQHGRQWRPQRMFDPGAVSLPMWVIGADAVSGAILSGDAAVSAFYERVDALLRLFHAPRLRIDHTLPDGSIRRAEAELADEPMDFTRQLGSPLFGRVVVELTIPGAFWASLDEFTAATPPEGVANGGVFSLAAFEPSNAPIADGLVTFGPGSNPTLIQGETFLAYDGVIAAGRQLTVDCSDWSLGVGSGSVWTPDLSKVRYGPGPSWFELDPTQVPLQAALSHTGGGLMFASFTARRRFLNG